MAEPNISVDEWSGLLQKLENEANDGGMTAHEIAHIFGRGIKWTRRKLKEGIGAGMIRVGQKTDQTIDGRRCLIPVYIMKK